MPAPIPVREIAGGAPRKVELPETPPGAADEMPTRDRPNPWTGRGVACPAPSEPPSAEPPLPRISAKPSAVLRHGTTIAIALLLYLALFYGHTLLGGEAVMIGSDGIRTVDPGTGATSSPFDF